MATQKKGYAGPGGTYSSYVPEIAGPQMPEKYERVGNNYLTFGEQPGYVYYPLQDKYLPDPKQQKKFAEDNGFTEKKKGLQEALLPIAATGATIAATQGLFSNPGAFLGSVGSGAKELGGLFGLGGGGGATTGAGAAASSGAAATTGAAATGALPAAPVIVGATEVPAAAASTGFLGSGLGAGPLAGIAAGTYLGGKAAYDMLRGKEDKSIPGLIGRGTLGIATGGISEIGKALGFWGQPSTKDIEKKRWGQLTKDGVVGAEAAFAANHAPDDDGIWDSGKYAGQKWSFEKALDLAKEDPSHFQHVLGNYQAIKDYGKLTNDQQRAITSQAANQNLYSGNKGDVLGDKTKLQQIANDVVAGKLGMFSLPGATPAATPAAQVAATPDKVNQGGQGLLGLLKSGDKMSDGRTYISPGVYR